MSSFFSQIYDLKLLIFHTVKHPEKKNRDKFYVIQRLHENTAI